MTRPCAPSGTVTSPFRDAPVTSILTGRDTGTAGIDGMSTHGASGLPNSIGSVVALTQGGEPSGLQSMRYSDRREAGQHLAQLLSQYAKRDDVVVLALPRGGVPVAFEVTRALEAPLDVFLVRKLGAPGHPEFAIGAIASGGVKVLKQAQIAYLRIRSE